jgi:hypothetical protein
MLVSIIVPFRDEEATLPVLLERLLQAGHTIHEVPVRYVPRTFRAGQKVRPRDGLRAPWALLRIRLEGRRRPA